MEQREKAGQFLDCHSAKCAGLSARQAGAHSRVFVPQTFTD